MTFFCGGFCFDRLISFLTTLPKLLLYDKRNSGVVMVIDVRLDADGVEELCFSDED